MTTTAAPERASSDTPDRSLPSRAWASTAAALVLLLTLVVGLGSQGSFYPDAQPRLAAGVALGLALALLGGLRARAGAAGTLVVAATALLLAAWALVAGALHGDATAGLPPSILAAGVAAVLLTVGWLEPGDRRLVLDSLPLVGGLLAVSAWVALLARTPDWVLASDGLWRAAGALGYPNALAAVLVPLAIVAVARAPARAGPGRWAATALATVMLATSAATLSRGGLLALAAGLAVLVLLGGHRVGRAAVGPLAGATVVTTALLPSLPEAAPANAPLATVGLVVGVLAAVLVDAAGSRRCGAATLLAPAAVATAGAALLVILAAESLRRAVWEVVSGRASAGSSYRLDAAAAAVRDLGSSPVIGTGPGAGQVTWQDERGAALTMRFLHNEYLQTLLELGVVGAVLLLAVLLAAARALWRARPDRTAEPGARAAWAGGTAACVAFAVHSSVDFLWHVPALPVLAGALLALAVTTRPARVADAGSAQPEPTGTPL